MHTLLEQSTEAWDGTDFTENFNHLLTDVLGYTKSGDYYYSPIDNNFGIYYTTSAPSIYDIVMTFDGGKTKKTYNLSGATINKNFKYHASKNEKVILIRCTDNSSSHTFSNQNFGFLISHDSSNGTMVFFSAMSTSSSSNSDANKITAADKTSVYFFDDIPSAECKIKANKSNAVYRTPSIANNCLHSELNSIVNVQSYPSRSGTYITFGDEVYRIADLNSVYGSGLNAVNTKIPYFAFPVSDT